MKYKKLIPFMLMLAVLTFAAANQVFIGEAVEGVEHIYKDITQEIPLTKWITTYREVCGTHEVCTNETKGIEVCAAEFSCYDVPEYTEVFDKMYIKHIATVKIGERKDEVVYYGYVHIDGDTLTEWDVPVGDRNFKEYPRCRAYEKAKGVCNERKI